MMTGTQEGNYQKVRSYSREVVLITVLFLLAKTDVPPSAQTSAITKATDANHIFS
jgi:hypothetical protein